MEQGLLTENVHFALGIAPSADIFNGDPGSDVVNMRHFEKACFIVCAVATTGQATLTIEACDNVTPSNTEAIPFKYRKTPSATSDATTAVAAATAAGITTDTSATKVYYLEIEAADLPEGKPFVRLKTNEEVDAAVVGSVLIALSGGGAQSSFPSALS